MTLNEGDRAAKQWFVKLSHMQSLAVQAVTRGPDVEGHVKMTPAAGRHRLSGYLQGRKDWCISRQRPWGVPIPAFYDENGEDPFSKDDTTMTNNVGQTWKS